MNRANLIFSSIVLCTSSASFFVYSSNDDALEHIEITGQKHILAGQSTTLNEEDIRSARSATSDTASLLEGIAGVSINAAGGLSSLPVIHGLADDRLRVKVNGIDLIASCPNHMNPPLSYMAPTDVGEITVYTGISPVSAGGDSIGGSILANSIAPSYATSESERIFSGEVGAFYRHNNNASGLNIAAQYQTINSFFRYSGNFSSADNYAAANNFKTATSTGRVGHTLPLDEVGSSAYETENHSLRIAFRAMKNEFDFTISYQDMPEQLYPNQRMDLLGNTQSNINAKWQRDTTWGELSIRVFHEDVEHFMNFGADKRFWYGSNAVNGAACEPIRFMGDPEGACAAGMPMHSDSQNSGGVFTANYLLGDHDELRMGLELQFYGLDDYWDPSGGGMGPDTFLNINNGQRDRLATFIEREHQLTPHINALYGLRIEQVSFNAGEVQGYSSEESAIGMQYANVTAFNDSQRKSTDYNVDATASISYHASKTLTTQIGYAHKVRSPNLYEKYTWSYWMMPASMNNFVGDGNGYVGNVNLQPEKAHTLSASLAWHSARSEHSFTLVPYFTYVEAFVDAVETTNWAQQQFNVLTYANQNAAIYGIDFSGEWDLGHGQYGHWQVNGTISATHSENTTTDSGLYQVVPLRSHLTLTHHYQDWESHLEWQVVAAKTNVSDVRNEIATAGYGLVNFNVQHNWSNLRIDIGVENLLDKFYFNPTGGAYTGQGTTMALNSITYGIAVPGMGRSIYAGVALSF